MQTQRAVKDTRCEGLALLATAGSMCGQKSLRAWVCAAGMCAGTCPAWAARLPNQPRRPCVAQDWKSDKYQDMIGWVRGTHVHVQALPCSKLAASLLSCLPVHPCVSPCGWPSARLVHCTLRCLPSLPAVRSGEVEPRPGVLRLMDEARAAGLKLAVRPWAHMECACFVYTGLSRSKPQSGCIGVMPRPLVHAGLCRLTERELGG